MRESVVEGRGFDVSELVFSQISWAQGERGRWVACRFDVMREDHFERRGWWVDVSEKAVEWLKEEFGSRGDNEGDEDEEAW